MLDLSEVIPTPPAAKAVSHMLLQRLFRYVSRLEPASPTAMAYNFQRGGRVSTDRVRVTVTFLGEHRWEFRFTQPEYQGAYVWSYNDRYDSMELEHDAEFNFTTMDQIRMLTNFAIHLETFNALPEEKKDAFVR